MPFGLQGITITNPYTYNQLSQHKKIHHAPLFLGQQLFAAADADAAAATSA